MNRRGTLRGLLGATAAIILATSGSALASGSASTDRSGQALPAAIHTAAACSPGARACPIRIAFGAGAFSGQAHSQLTGIRSKKWFVVSARAGQTMVVVVAGLGPTSGTVLSPNGESNGQPGGRVFDDSLPVSGKYLIRVAESQMGEAWSGRVDVVALVY